MELTLAISARDVIGTGGGTVALESAKGLARLGHRVALITDVPVDPQVVRLDGIEIRVTHLGPRLKRWQVDGKLARSVKHLAQLVAFGIEGRQLMAAATARGEVTIDHNCEAGGGAIVVVHNVFKSQWLADRRRWYRKLPQLGNPTFWLRIIRERLVLSNEQVRLVAVSPETAEEVQRALGRPRTIDVIRSGVDTDRFHPGGAANGSRAPAGMRTIVFSGHEFERKRLDLVIDALALLPKNYLLRVAGGRFSSRETYVAQAIRRGVADRIEFLGTIADVENLYRTADVFVLPSNYETWGLVCMEALACGVPVVMTQVGCADEVIVAGETGYIIGYDATEIAQAVRSTVANADTLAVMRAHARAMAERYSWVRVSREYEALALATKVPAHV